MTDCDIVTSKTFIVETYVETIHVEMPGNEGNKTFEGPIVANLCLCAVYIGRDCITQLQKP